MPHCTRHGKVLCCLLFAILLLVLASSLTLWSEPGFDKNQASFLTRMFNLDVEYNIPTFFSSLMLLASGYILFILSKGHRRGTVQFRYWVSLSFIFGVLSLDELLCLHERTVLPIRNMFHANGLLFYSWVILYGVGVLILFFIYLRFVLQLPRRTRNLIMLSAAIYVTGAIGMEMLGGRHHELYGYVNLQYAIYYTVEETLEMVGIALFIYTLLDYKADLAAQEHMPPACHDRRSMPLPTASPQAG